MSDVEITAFLPCRKGSQRIKNKNVRSFAGFAGGLVQLKLEQLAKVRSISRVIVSTDDDCVKSFASAFADQCPGKITIDTRPDYLATSEATTDSVINYVKEKFNFQHILWTHCTSPFVDEFDYELCIEKYKEVIQKGNDSLMTVQKHQGFYWRQGQPLSYDREIERWPRTQTIEPIYEVDSAVFLASKSVYENFGDRIGSSPYLLDLEKPVNIDIDWPEQFLLAEIAFRKMGDFS